MGKVTLTTRDEILEVLRESNPRKNDADISIYADALMTYREAQDNISRNGAVAAHPRTGAPMENPYLKVRDKAVSTLRKIRLAAPGLWT